MTTTKTKTIANYVEGCPQADISQFEIIQGGIKKAFELEKLKATVLAYGIREPSFVWIKPDTGALALIGGTQRDRIYAELHKEGYSFRVPYVAIPAANITEARQKILLACSIYAKISKKEFKQVSDTIDISKIMPLLSTATYRFLAESHGAASDEQDDATDRGSRKITSMSAIQAKYVIEFSTEAKMRRYTEAMKVLRDVYEDDTSDAEILLQMLDGARNMKRLEAKLKSKVKK